jgi:hypothetical protein
LADYAIDMSDAGAGRHALDLLDRTVADCRL